MTLFRALACVGLSLSLAAPALAMPSTKAPSKLTATDPRLSPQALASEWAIDRGFRAGSKATTRALKGQILSPRSRIAISLRKPDAAKATTELLKWNKLATTNGWRPRSLASSPYTQGFAAGSRAVAMGIWMQHKIDQLPGD